MENQKLVNVADSAHPKMSPKYKTVQTNLIAKKFKDLGFTVDEILQRRSQRNGGYGKHMVKLSHPTLLRTVEHSDLKLQLIVTNSFDGTSAFKIQLGFFRFVCSNGMIIGQTLDSYSHRHTGNIIEEIDQTIERIVAQTEKLSGIISKMKGKTLSVQEITNFEKEAVKLRSDKIDSVEWTTRRDADKPTDLFTVYNRIQEDLVRGGTAATSVGGRVRVLREIKGVDKLKKLNEDLFDLAVKFAA